MVRCEHRTDRRHDDVERGIVERQVLGVAFDPFELDALGLRSPTTSLEQFRREIAGGYARAALCGWDRGVARTGSDVEDAHPGTDPASFYEPRPQGQEKRLDH